MRYFLPSAAKCLNAEVIIPHDANVASAIGAITSCVLVSKQVEIRPNDDGGYAVHGLPDARNFGEFDSAQAYAVRELERLVQSLARAAGTSERHVEMHADDRISATADGTQLFLGRIINARLSGPPDIMSLARSG